VSLLPRTTTYFEMVTNILKSSVNNLVKKIFKEINLIQWVFVWNFPLSFTKVI